MANISDSIYLNQVFMRKMFCNRTTLDKLLFLVKENTVWGLFTKPGSTKVDLLFRHTENIPEKINQP